MTQLNLQTSEDTILWNEIIQGKKQALEMIYTKYYNSLYRYGMCYSGNENLVEDCIQDLFVSIFENKTLRSVQYVQAYLIKSLRNLILHQLQKTNCESLDEYSFDVAINDTMLTSIFHKDDQDLCLSKKLTAAYKSLSDMQRHIIYLRYVRNLSYSEISEILNINVQSAMNLLSRTLGKLRDSVVKKDS